MISIKADVSIGFFMSVFAYALLYLSLVYIIFDMDKFNNTHHSRTYNIQAKRILCAHKN